MEKISIIEMEKLIKNYWTPLDLFKINDIKVRLVKLKGKYHWHKHSEEDEIFFVVSGQMVIHLKNKDITLNPYEGYMVPRNVEHLTESENGALVLLIEPAGIKITGD